VTTVEAIGTEANEVAREQVSQLRRWWNRLKAVPTPALFAISAVIATLVLWRKGSLDDIGPALQTLPPGRVVAILAVYAMSILVLAIRWHVLANMAGGTPEWFSSAEVFLTSVIVNYAAPIGLAVPTRAALTVRDLGLSPLASSAVVGWELVLDLVALSILSVGWLAMGGLSRLNVLSTDPRIFATFVIIVVLATCCLGIAYRVSPSVRRLTRSVKPMIQLPADRPGLMFVAIGLTLVFWAAQTGVMTALLSGFGTTPSLSLLLGVMGLPILIGMLSPIPGGAGIRETLMAAAAGLQGVATAPVLLAAIVYRLALFVVTPVVWGGLRLARTLATSR
jgi:uncharacterized membrane protein YbhN (UPF0104 family)